MSKKYFVARTIGGRFARVHKKHMVGFLHCGNYGPKDKWVGREWGHRWCDDGFNHKGLALCLDLKGRYSRLTDAQKVDVNSESNLYVQWELIGEYHAQNQFRRAIYYGVSISIILWSIFYYMWIIA